MKTKIIAEVEEILRNKAEWMDCELAECNNNLTETDMDLIKGYVNGFYDIWVDKWNKAIERNEDGISMGQEMNDLFEQINSFLQIPKSLIDKYDEIDIALAVSKVVLSGDKDFQMGYATDECVVWSF